MPRHSHRFPTTLLPSMPGLQLVQTELADQVLTVHLRTTAATTPCPRCQQPSSAVHSHYTRTVADLPWGGTAVRLVLHVRKFFCRTLPCAQRIFTERLPHVVAPYARTTMRLGEVLRLLAFALGGEAGARLCERLQMPASPASLIARIRHTVLPQQPTPRVVGVDDWAKRRGRSHGTILVDLEAHRPIDLLPDRRAETLTAWLTHHPGVEIITRDRAGAYAEGATQGAPAAIQVADRWHLLQNWAEVVERVLQRHHRLLHQIQVTTPVPPGTTATTLLPPKSVNRQRHYADLRRDQARRVREARWTTTRERYLKGVSLADIARELCLNYKTVRKYAHATACPHPPPTPPRHGRITPYVPYLQARWAEGCHNGAKLYREIWEHGFRGDYTLVKRVLRPLRQAAGVSWPWVPTLTPQQPLTPRIGVGLLMRRPHDRSTNEHAVLAQLGHAHAELDELLRFSKRYTHMLRARQPNAFDPWMADAHASALVEVRQFARNMRNDEAAIRAALVYEHSNGQVEGQVHRLKLVKRSMYGRAKFDLLRQRVLYRMT